MHAQSMETLIDEVAVFLAFLKSERKTCARYAVVLCSQPPRFLLGLFLAGLFFGVGVNVVLISIFGVGVSAMMEILSRRQIHLLRARTELANARRQRTW